MQRFFSSLMQITFKNLFLSENENFDPNVGLKATEASNYLLKNFGMLVKQRPTGLILIASQEGDQESDVSNLIDNYVKNNLKIRFKINITSSEFFRYTKLDIDHNIGEILYLKIKEPGTISSKDFTSCVLFNFVEKALWDKVGEQLKTKEKITLAIIPSQEEAYNIEIASREQIGKLSLAEGSYKFRIGEEDLVFKTPEGKTFDTFYFDRTFIHSNEIGILEIDSFEFLKDHLARLPIHSDILFDTHSIHVNYQLIRKNLSKDIFDTLRLHSSSEQFIEANTEDTRTFTIAEGSEGQLSPKAILLSDTKSMDISVKTADNEILIPQLPIPSLGSLQRKDSTDSEVMLESTMYIYI